MKIIQHKLIKNSLAYVQGYVRKVDHPLPAMLIVPGGSFTHIPYGQAESFALDATARGYQSFYLRYSFSNEKDPLYPYPLKELCAAIAYLRQNATKFHINPQQITVEGFSIGGHVVALLNDFYDDPWFKKEIGFTDVNAIRPNATILGYPVIDLKMGFPKETVIPHWIDNQRELRAEYHVTDTNVPTFIWTTADDNFVDSRNALAYGYELDKHHIKAEIHMFFHGHHGMALANRVTAHEPDKNDPHVAHWTKLADEFLRSIYK